MRRGAGLRRRSFRRLNKEIKTPEGTDGFFRGLFLIGLISLIGLIGLISQIGLIGQISQISQIGFS